MTNAFIIGLPQQERGRVESLLLRREMRVQVVTIGWGNRGEYCLQPHPSTAIHSLWEYCNTVGDGFGDALIFVMPYAPLPDDLQGELQEMANMGAQVIYFAQGEDGWPVLRRKTKMDQQVSTTITKLLIAAICGPEEFTSPSAYIAEAIAACPQLVVVADAIDSCDEVTVLRYQFIKDSIDLLVEIIRLNGRTAGTMEAFFKTRNLIFAQTGGDQIQLEIFLDGICIQKATSQIHLKQGDGTSRHNCPRIYYQHLEHASGYYVFLLYVGPHRDGNFSRVYHL
jgi:hypothetical protein